MRAPTQLTARNRAGVFLALAALVLTGCGTRLADADFQTIGQVGANGTPIPGVSPTAGSGTSTLPPGSNGGTAGTPGEEGTDDQTVTDDGPGGNKNNNPDDDVDGGASAAQFSELCGAAPSGTQNKASDRGVTANSITVGNITSDTNPFGSDQFSPPRYGAYAFVQYCNSRGGINGRTIDFKHCNDQGTGSGNQTCVNGLLGQNVFAFIGNNSFQYPGAKTVSDAKVPDIGGIPIEGEAYYTYPHIYNLYGDGYPKNNSGPGYKGRYWGLPSLGQFYANYSKHVNGAPDVERAGVVYYDQADSQRGYREFKASLEAAGLSVSGYAIQITGTPDAAVEAMKENKVQIVFDALDNAGNQKLCQSMNNRDFTPIAKVSTISTWTAHVGSAFDPPCRDIIQSTGSSANYDRTSHPMVKQFRDDFARSAGNQTLAQWAMEGYISAIWFAQGVKSCGVELTRACVEKWLNDQNSLSAYGLLDKTINFKKIAYSEGKSGPQCNEVVRWVGGESGHWETIGNVSQFCPTGKYYSYPA